MGDITIHELATEVAKMRKAQKLYFIQKGNAMKAKDLDTKKDQLKVAGQTLQLSKALEKMVDQKVEHVLLAGKEVVS